MYCASRMKISDCYIHFLLVCQITQAVRDLLFDLKSKTRIQIKINIIIMVQP
jgi:hypothetical protein